MIALGAAKVIALGRTMMRAHPGPRIVSRNRTDMHQLQEPVRLHRLGTGARKVARLLGVTPNTEREYRLAFLKADLLLGPRGRSAGVGGAEGDASVVNPLSASLLPG